ncbi:MAG: hypothetical protein M3P93_04670, partial [Actinomycetota bacterium]|nr:hypothetical protein [Actinomycetota bacterium]
MLAQGTGGALQDQALGALHVQLQAVHDPIPDELVDGGDLDLDLDLDLDAAGRLVEDEVVERVQSLGEPQGAWTIRNGLLDHLRGVAVQRDVLPHPPG